MQLRILNAIWISKTWLRQRAISAEFCQNQADMFHVMHKFVNYKNWMISFSEHIFRWMPINTNSIAEACIDNLSNTAASGFNLINDCPDCKQPCEWELIFGLWTLIFDLWTLSPLWFSSSCNHFIWVSRSTNQTHSALLPESNPTRLPCPPHSGPRTSTRWSIIWYIGFPVRV